MIISELEGQYVVHTTSSFQAFHDKFHAVVHPLLLCSLEGSMGFTRPRRI
jgi:hypothetical protein